MSKVCVIIPVYNTAAYIARCCHSLFAQTLRDMQFVFVDDGSTDGSIEIVRSIAAQYSERKDQVLILSQSHQGVSAARQCGLDHAEGEYIIHCDSDDWVEQVAYEQLYKHAKATHADIVTFGYLVEDEEGNKLKTVHALNVAQSFSFSIGPQMGSLCLKLIRRDFLLRNRLNLPAGINWGEDSCLSLQALILSSNTQSLDLPLYHYGQYKSSITHTVDTQQCAELVKCGEVVETFLRQHQLYEKYSDQLLWLKFQLKQYFLIFPQVRDIGRWQELYPECHPYLMNFESPLYLRLSGWLIIHGLKPVATLLLSIRDFLSTCKHL